MIDVINICRSERPSERLPATELLRILNNNVVPASHCGWNGSAEPLDMEEIVRLYEAVSGCDRRGGYITTRLGYHCNICDNSDFDICVKCFNDGRHCKDLDHFLPELRSHMSTGRSLG